LRFVKGVIGCWSGSLVVTTLVHGRHASSNFDEDQVVEQVGSSQELRFAKRHYSNKEDWKSYFSNPSMWSDNRESKKSAKSVDFKHKYIGRHFGLMDGTPLHG